MLQQLRGKKPLKSNQLLLQLTTSPLASRSVARYQLFSRASPKFPATYVSPAQSPSNTFACPLTHTAHLCSPAQQTPCALEPYYKPRPKCQHISGHRLTDGRATRHIGSGRNHSLIPLQRSLTSHNERIAGLRPASQGRRPARATLHSVLALASTRVLHVCALQTCAALPRPQVTHPRDNPAAL